MFSGSKLDAFNSRPLPSNNEIILRPNGTTNASSFLNTNAKEVMEYLDRSDNSYQVMDPIIRTAILLQTGEFSDVCFVVGNDSVLTTRFHLHKWILATASPVFHAMFFGSIPEGKEIIVSDTTPDSFEIVINYIYCGLVPKNLSPEQGNAAFYATRKYLLHRLESRLEISLLTHPLGEGDIFYLYSMSSFYQLQLLQNFCENYIGVHIMKLISTNAFLQLELSLLLKILELDCLQIKEIDLYNAICWWGRYYKCTEEQVKYATTEFKWGRHDEISARIKPCLKLIRFPTMSALEFANGPGRGSHMSMADIGSILLNICSTSHFKPFCAFPNRVRGEVANASVIAVPMECGCSENCIYCYVHKISRSQYSSSNNVAILRGVGVYSITPTRRSTAGTITPASYCPCRTQGLCSRKQSNSKHMCDVQTSFLPSPNVNRLCSAHEEAASGISVHVISPPMSQGNPQIREANLQRPLRISPPQRPQWRI